MREPTYLVLLALAGAPLHGYGVIAAVRDLTDGRTTLGVGTLYGALDRLRDAGWIEADHDEVVEGRLRRYYRLTGAGLAALGEETRRRAVLAARATEVLDATGWVGVS